MDIEYVYNEIEKKFNDKNLKDKGIKLPSLYYKKKYSKKALVLVYLYSKSGELVSKENLTIFVRKYHPKTTDVQQARHLSTQDGWNIFKDGRGNYKFEDMEEVYPGFHVEKRIGGLSSIDFNELKKIYKNRCAICGAQEGLPHYKYEKIVRLEKGHMDPNKELTLDNTIPQCSECNQIYKDKFIFDKMGIFLDKNYDSVYWSK